MKTVIFAHIFCIIVLSACGANAGITESPNPVSTSTSVPTFTLSPTAIASPTLTPWPTLSPFVFLLKPGEVVLHPPTDSNPYAFYSYFPNSAVREKTITIGIWTESVDRLFDDYEYCVRRAKEYAQWLSVYSERYKIPIVVMAIPGDENFARITLHLDTFSNEDNLSSRPDLKVIDAVWNQYLPTLTDAGFATNDKVFMFGDQGSGVFPHRFAILHPELVQALWESSSAPAPLPAAEFAGEPLDYPLGINNLEELTGKPFNLEAYLKIHQFIMAGEYDDVGIITSDFFPNGQWQFIRTHFGSTDAEMVEFFYNYLISIGASVEFRLYKSIGNRLTDEMINDAFRFLVSHSQP